MKFHSIICFKLDKYHSEYNSYEITERERESRGQGAPWRVHNFSPGKYLDIWSDPNIRITPLNPIHSIVGLPHNGAEAHNARIGTHWRFFCLHPRFFNVYMQLVQLYWVFVGRFYQKNVSVCSFNILISPGRHCWVDDPDWPRLSSFTTKFSIPVIYSGL